MLPPPDVIIATCKTEDEITPLRVYVEGYSMDCRVIPTCQKGSASINRNYGLNLAKSPVVIEIDDDVSGFYRGWWRDLISPLEDPNVIFVSARLMTEDGSLSGMMYGSNNLDVPIEDVPQAPTACCAFRNDGMRFDTAFVGGGFEDKLFCWQLRKRYTNGRILVNNECRIIHFNEMKNQLNDFYEHNKQVYESKTGIKIPMSLDDIDGSEMVVT